jgi:uncharacterized protein YjdB
MILSVMFAALCSCSEEDPAAISTIELDKTQASIPIGGTTQLHATVYPESVRNKMVIWYSDNDSIAMVDANGLVRGIAPGLTVIRIAASSGIIYPATCAISVYASAVSVTGVSITKSETTISVNGSETLNHIVAPANATNKNVTWSSNNASVATVDGNGRVTGIAAGEATITLTTEEGGFTSSCVVTVISEEIPVTEVSLDKTAIDMYIGDVEQLSATVVPANATNTEVTWSSSSTAVVTVSDAGLVTGISDGTATVTVTSTDGEFTATCTVTVKNERGTVTSTGWSAPSPNRYEYSMTYVAQVAFRGTLSTDVNTEVAAFVGNELRGYAKLVHEPKLNVYLIYLIIYSNSAGNETVVLKAYNPAKQRIYENCKTFVFHGDQSLGSSSEILNCLP